MPKNLCKRWAGDSLFCMEVTENPRRVRIIGIDPGFHRTGIGIIEESLKGKPKFIFATTIETKAGTKTEERLLDLFTKIEDIVAQWKPDEAAVEYLYFPTHASTTVIEVVQARGVILLALGRAKIKIAEYSPREIKMAITPTGWRRAHRPPRAEGSEPNGGSRGIST